MTGSLARGSRRISPTGPAFVRLLAALDDVPTPAAKDAFAQRLSQWFDWTDAISLSAALDCPAAPGTEAGPVALLFAAADEREARRVRAALAKLISGAPPTAAGRHARTPAPVAPADGRADFAPHRERCVACQQAMETAIATLRRRVRATLEGASPALARLAALDTVMEQVVGARERALLATVPLKLDVHFSRLRQAHREACAEAEPAAAADWLDTFGRDMRDLLLAELDLRLQPVEGLLDALRGASTNHHE